MAVRWLHNQVVSGPAARGLCGSWSSVRASRALRGHLGVPARCNICPALDWLQVSCWKISSSTSHLAHHWTSSAVHPAGRQLLLYSSTVRVSCLDCLQVRKQESLTLRCVKVDFAADKDVAGSSLMLRKLVMGQYDPFRNFTIHFSKIHFNITLLPSGLVQRYCTSMTLCTLFNPRQSPASWLRCSYVLASLQANVTIAAYLHGLNLILPTHATVNL